MRIISKISESPRANAVKKGLFKMKKLLSFLLILCFCLPCAAAWAENETVYSCDSVVDCEKSLADEAYADFRNAGELSVVIPGCSQTFVPQGLAYYAPQNLMFFTGYDSEEGSPSSIIAVDMQTNMIVKEIFLKNMDGSWYTGHAGGVCVTDRNIFVANASHLYRLPMSDFMAAEISDALCFVEAIPVPCKASYCQISDDILWVGEFYYAKNEAYHTDESHYFIRKDGPYHSWLLGYQLTNDTENELNPASMTAEGAIPDYILATTDRIQGAAFCDGRIFLSQSYGRNNNSTIYRYGNVLETDPAMEVQVLDASRPLWFLDSAAREAKLECPPMTEGLCTVDGSVYVAFESAATLYRAPEKKNEKSSRDPMDRVYKLNPLGF